MSDGSTAVSAPTSTSVTDTQSWFTELAGGVAALRSGGNMPADHIQSCSRGEVSSLDSAGSGTVNRVKHFLHRLLWLSSALSYIS